MRELRPGSELAGYRIESVEREGEDAAVLLARDPLDERAVWLHIAGDPPGSLSTTRFLERARRLGAVEHPHLLGVLRTQTLDGHAIAIAQAPQGKRLDELIADGPIPPQTAVRIVRQVASAVDAVEDAGAEPPPLTAEAIWVDADGSARLDGLGMRSGAPLAPSSSAALAGLLEDMTHRVPAPICPVIARARDGAYLSAGQLASDLGAVAHRAAARRREIATLVLGAATLILFIVLLVELA
ncbi:MAG TPA: hypothetical protein VFZ00_16300 [Solirubrobacter sp.]|nr:hypothetical protein [Solirubrobacter sp.]